MCSFDIKNLFTNIPVSETINIKVDKLFIDDKQRHCFKTFLDITILNSFFIFNPILYKQIKRVGHGQPLGPTFVNIFISFHEKKC